MKKNLGNADKIIRLIIAAVIAFLYYNGTIGGTLGLVLIIFAGVFLLTSLISFCPLYSIFGFNSCSLKK